MKRNNLKKILNENTSGSSELVYMINKFFKNNIDDENLITISIARLNTELKSFGVVPKNR